MVKCCIAVKSQWLEVNKLVPQVCRSLNWTHRSVILSLSSTCVVLILQMEQLESPAARSAPAPSLPFRFQSLGRDSELGKQLWSHSGVPQQAGTNRVHTAPSSAHWPAGRAALCARDGERRFWTGPIPPAERVRGRAVRGVHRQSERQGPVLGELDRERPDHQEDLLFTRPD